MDLQKIYELASVRQVYNFYSSYQDHYKSISMDLEDLEQEIKIAIFNKLQDPKVAILEEEDLLKYINTLTKRTLIKFIRRSVKTDKTIAKRGIHAVDDTNKNYPEKIINFLKTEYEISEKDYSLLYARFVENKTYRQISEDLNIKSSGTSVISGRIKRILRKCNLRKYRLYDFIYNLNCSEDRIDQILDEDSLHFMHKHLNICIEEDFKDILNDKEMYIVTEKITHNTKDQDIANTLNITQQGVNKIYKKSIAKIKKILKKEL